MTEFIVKYWLQFLFGLIATGMTIVAKRLWTLYKNEKNHQKTKEQQEFYDGIKDAIRQEHKITEQKFLEERNQSDQCDSIITDKIDSLGNKVDKITEGLISVQGETFRTSCRMLLDPKHEITLDELEQTSKDHDIYNSLGGNHMGDQLFDMVCAKYKNNLK